MSIELETEGLDPQLMMMRDAIDIRLAAAGIFNSEIEGSMVNHSKEGVWVALTITMTAPYPPLPQLVELRQELLGMFAGGSLDFVLAEEA